MSDNKAFLAVIAIVVTAFLFGFLAHTITEDPVAQRIRECRNIMDETNENRCLEMVFAMKEVTE